MLSRPAIVLDCGTGFSKIGFAGNAEPSFVLPTAILAAPRPPPGAAPSGGPGGLPPGPAAASPLAALSDLDCAIGEEALAAAAAAGGALPGAQGPPAAAAATGGHGAAGLGPGAGGWGGGGLVYPVRQGLVVDWDAMERFWHKAMFTYLRADPEEHCVVLSEPPLNPPEAREAMAEIMFETFNVRGMHVGVSAVMALHAAGGCAPGGSPSGPCLTGTVVDVGEGATTVIPVVDGYVLGGAVRSLPAAGRAVTAVVQQMMRDRGEPVPPDVSLEVARRVKEAHCYVAPDMLREFSRYDCDPAKHCRRLALEHPRTGVPLAVELGYERFLAPELFFSPGMAVGPGPGPAGGQQGPGHGAGGPGSAMASGGAVSLPRAVDDVIQSCPIDTRRALYGNIVLAGGSTMMRNFGRRLAADLTAATSRRLQPGATAIDICVRSHAMQRWAAWFGGSLLACGPGFGQLVTTREQYMEQGPSVCRANHVFRDG